MYKKGFVISSILSLIFLTYYFFEVSPWEFTKVLEVDKPISDKLLLAKEKINFIVTPNDNYMGEIHIGTNLRGRKNKDDVVFRLRPASDENWLVIGIYNTLLIVPGQKASFRFPPIPNSKNQTYLLEFESSSGTENNSISFYSEPEILIQYQYPKDKFFSGNYSIPHVVGLKVNTFIHSQYWIYDIFYFFSPLLSWLFLVFLFKRNIPIHTELKKHIVNKYNWVFVIGVLVAIQFQLFLGYLGTAIILAPWLYLVCERKINPKTGLFTSAICTSIIPFLLLPRFENTATYLASLTILFLIAYILLEVMNAIEPNLDRTLYLRLIKAIKKTISFLSPHFIRYVIPYAPYVTSILLFLVFVSDLRGFVVFFQGFFPNRQFFHFFIKTGFTLIVSDLLVILSTIFYVRLRKIKIKFWITLSIAIFLLWRVNLIVYDKTTLPFRDKPSLWEISPSETVEAWVDVTIEGVNMNDLPDTGQILINEMPQRIIRWSNNEVTFRTDPTISTSGEITVIRSDGVRSNKLNFTYTPK